MAEGNVNPKLWAAVTILVAVLGCIGVIIAAAIGILPEMTKPELSPTPVPINITPSTIATQPVATVTDVPVQPTTKPLPTTSLCPDTVARSVVSMWDIGATDKGNVQPYLDDYESHRKKGGGFAKGDTILSGVIVATDFGNGESEVWQTYPVEPIVHYRSWGLFEVTRNFSAPSEGSCITIVP